MLEMAIRLARAAGHIARAAYLSSSQVSHKGPRDLLTDVDIAAQRLIVSGLRSRFPDHAILAEEEGFDRAPAAEWTWVIDPLDGTTNFARGFPDFCVSIGLLHRDRPHLGVVYDPLRDHLFHARCGEGAWVNGRRLQVSRTPGLTDALMGFDWARSDERRRLLVTMVSHVSRQAIAVRSLGVAALGLCYVAAGWYDAYFNFELRVWDVAAGAVLIEEAGGQISTLDGGPIGVETRTCLASNGLLHQLLRDEYASVIWRP